MQASQYITTSEYEEGKGENDIRIQQAFVFDRIQPPLVSSRCSVFERLEGCGENSGSKHVFDRLGGQENSIPLSLSRRDVFTSHGKRTKKSIFSRIGKSDKRQWRLKEKQMQMKGDMELDKDVRSIIPSRMKRLTILEIQTGELLTMKGRTTVVTNQLSSDGQRGDRDTMAISNHIAMCEVSTPEDEEVETSEAPKSLEHGGQATVDGHKESNPGTEGEPRPVYVSALLSQEEENAKLDWLSWRH
ncbi:Velvet complex subunit B [Bienertia sinuspersici]